MNKPKTKSLMQWSLILLFCAVWLAGCGGSEPACNDGYVISGNQCILNGSNFRYVSTTGSNSNDGTTPQTAWRTVTYAASQAVAGNTIYIKAGFYQNESISIPRSGTLNEPIVFQGYHEHPGDTPNPQYNPYGDINSALIPVLEGFDRGSVIEIINTEYIEIRNLGLTKGVYGIFTFNNARHFIIENVYTRNNGLGAGGGGIYIMQSDSFTVRNCVVTDAGMENLIVRQSHDGLIENCKSYAVNYNIDPSDYHIVLQDTQNTTVQNCQAYNLHPYNAGTPGHGIGIKDEYKGGAYNNPHSTNNKIINCEAYDMGEYFYVAHEAYANEFVNCKAVGHYENPLQDTWSEAINIRDGAHDNIFRNFREEHIKTSIAIQNTPEGPTNYSQFAYNNLITNSTFIASNVGIEAWDSTNNTIKNSVFDDTGRKMFLFFPDNRDTVVGTKIINSIIMNSTGWTYSANNFPGIVSDIPVEYSAFWNNANFTQAYNGSFYSVNPLSGIGDISVNPQFVDSVNGDYHLKSIAGRWNDTSATWVTDTTTSPLIDAGSPADDFSLEPAPNGGRINIDVYGNTIYASKTN